MPRAVVQQNERMNLRLPAATKAKLVRAAGIRHTDLTSFVLEPALREAEAVIAEAEHIRLSSRDQAAILALLENPPAPNARLRAAAAALPITV